MEALMQRVKLKTRPISELPPRTADDLEYEKDPEAYERSALRKSWNEEIREFSQLKRLALRLKIKRVIVTRHAPSSMLGRYLPTGDWESSLAKEWGLSKKQEKLILKSGPTILICRDSTYDDEGACRFLAHEIGHHICQLAGLSPERLNATASKKMCRFFPDNAYLQKQNNIDEFLSECFAEYLTCDVLRKPVERSCNEIVRQLRRHDPSKAALLEQRRISRGA